MRNEREDVVGRAGTRRRLLVVLSMGVLFAFSVVMATTAMARTGDTGRKDSGVRVETEQIGPTAAPQSENTRGTAAGNCKNMGGRVSYYNSSDQLLAYFQAVQRWCWNYSAVTYASPPEVVGRVTQAGLARGWKYRGVVAQSDFFFEYQGYPRGGHNTTRQGKFFYRTPEGRQEQLPQVKLITYYNGNGYSVVK